MSKPIELTTTSRKLLADIYSPVGIYLRLRDRFRDTILLESADYHAGENSYSFIGIHAIGGIEIRDPHVIEYKFPGEEPKKIQTGREVNVPEEIWKYMQHFSVSGDTGMPVSMAQGLFGYTTYDAIRFFEDIHLPAAEGEEPVIPLMRYRLYQYVIAINHFRNELYICENHVKGLESNLSLLETIIASKNVPSYPFEVLRTETSPMDDDTYRQMVRKGIASCARGDVFQVVLSRSFQQQFAGDEFNVYRTLRSINPSPYLFYFDYGDYRLFGSSPESQVIVKKGEAIVHPIAGTFRRTGHEETDVESANRLLKDKKENAEHVMLVDLARNDLSRMCTNVRVSKFCEVQYFSHVIHLVSEVKGKVPVGANPVALLAAVFPAGTLSGAPKYKAMQLIDAYENNSRSYYGGTIGFMGFNGDVNHAIMIRTFLSRQNTLHYRAGAGITISSDPDNELQEVNNKLNALTAAIKAAQINAQ